MNLKYLKSFLVIPVSLFLILALLSSCGSGSSDGDGQDIDSGMNLEETVGDDADEEEGDDIVEDDSANESPELTAQRNTNEFLIDGATYHPLGDDLTVVINFPDGASSDNPVPACAIIHGSGGLFKEEVAGEACGEDLESNFQTVSDLLVDNGVATFLPSSFYSRDPRFCEDNDDAYREFAGAPFYPEDDVDKARDTNYKVRRVAIRAMDMLATMEFMCDLEEIDCDRTCMVGTSNGGTSIYSYLAQSLETDLPEYLTDEQRTYEDADDLAERILALEDFPEVDVGLSESLSERPLPLFAQVISPGCGLRDLVPDEDPVDALSYTDLYYPAEGVDMILEVGTADSVPDACYDGGIRDLQVVAYEDAESIAAQDSQYVVETHSDGPHDLLRDETYGPVIRDRLEELVDQYF